MVEFSPATREARVRFPASAKLFLYILSIVSFYLLLPDIKSLIFFKSLKLLLRSEIELFHMTSRSPLTGVPKH